MCHVLLVFLLVCILPIALTLGLIVYGFMQLAITVNYGKGMEIFDKRTVELCKTKQTIFLEGKNKSNPVMIMLHGGPLVPFVYGSSFRGLYEDLRSEYTLVWWDEYGVGKNYVHYSKLDNFEISQWVDMTVDLIKYIRKEFPTNKIVINGYSFGTYLSTCATNRITSEGNITISGLINMGPILDMMKDSQYYVEKLKDKISAKQKAKIDELNRTKRYHDLQDYVESLAEEKLNSEIYHGPYSENSMYRAWMYRLFVSPDYSVADRINFIKTFLTMNKHYSLIWSTFMAINMTEDYKAVKVPTIFLQGSEEIHAMKSEIDDLFKGKPNYQFYVINKSAHCPTTSGWKQITKHMIEFKKLLL